MHKYIFYFLFLLSYSSIAQQVELFKDINTATENTEILFSANRGDSLFFATQDTDGFRSLWLHIPQINETRLILKDSSIYAKHSFVGLQVWKNKAFFVLGNQADRQLWVSEGSAETTRKIKEGLGYFYEYDFNTYQYQTKSYLYFFTAHLSPYTIYPNTEIWRTDGTETGTQFADYNNLGRLYPTLHKTTDSALYYIKMSGYNSFVSVNPKEELWMHNGEESRKIATLSDDINKIYTFSMYNFNNKLVMFRDSSYFSTMYIANETGQLSVVKKNRTSRFQCASASFCTVRGNKVFFQWNDSSYSDELWVSDGTTNGTYRLTANEYGINSYKNVNGYLLLQADRPETSQQAVFYIKPNSETLTPIKTQAGEYIGFYSPSLSVTFPFTFANGKGYMRIGRIAEIDTASNRIQKYLFTSASDSSVINIYSIQDRLIFQACSYPNTYNQDLYLLSSTGKAIKLADALPNHKPTFTKLLMTTPNYLYFEAHSIISGKEIWRTDGTLNGTVMLRDISIKPGSSFPFNMIKSNTGIFFQADNSSHGKEPWFISSATMNSGLKYDVFKTFTSPYLNGFGKLGDYFFSLHNNRILTRFSEINSPYTIFSSSTIDDHMYDAQFTAFKNSLFYIQSYDIYQSFAPSARLYKIGPSPTSTPVPLLSNVGVDTIQNLTVVDTTLFFLGYNAYNKKQLWKTNGNASGTVIVSDLTNVTSPNYNNNFTALASGINRLIFTTDNGTKLWQSDGTNANTYMIQNFGAMAKVIMPCINFNGETFVLIKNAAFGEGLYKILSNSAQLVSNVSLSNIAATHATVYGGFFFFFGNDGLYKSDGTAAGTSLIYSGIKGSNFTPAFGKVFFNGCDHRGCELWRLDSASVELHTDINTGAGSSDPKNMFFDGKNMFFSAYMPAVGEELFWLTNCPKNRSISSSISGNVKYEASEVIMASNKILSGNNVTYDAGKSVILLPDFEVNTGTTFRAYINGCNEDN